MVWVLRLGMSVPLVQACGASCYRLWSPLLPSSFSDANNGCIDSRTFKQLRRPVPIRSQTNLYNPIAKILEISRVEVRGGVVARVPGPGC
jgi:hypothetical protein